jgi:hypothetical protein
MIPTPDYFLTDEEFGHLAIRLNECRCETCKRISVKICNLRKLGDYHSREVRAYEEGKADTEQRIADLLGDLEMLREGTENPIRIKALNDAISLLRKGAK